MQATNLDFSHRLPPQNPTPTEKVELAVDRSHEHYLAVYRQAAKVALKPLNSKPE